MQSHHMSISTFNECVLVCVYLFISQCVYLCVHASSFVRDSVCWFWGHCIGG